MSEKEPRLLVLLSLGGEGSPLSHLAAIFGTPFRRTTLSASLAEEMLRVVGGELGDSPSSSLFCRISRRNSLYESRLRWVAVSNCLTSGASILSSDRLFFWEPGLHLTWTSPVAISVCSP